MQASAIYGCRSWCLVGGWFLGSYDGFIYALVALVTIDYITGVMRAFVEKQLSSEIGGARGGIVKKGTHIHSRGHY